MRDLLKVQARLSELRSRELTERSLALPKGYQVGLALQLTSEGDNVQVLPGIIEVNGQTVYNTETYALVASDYLVSRLRGIKYYLYVDKGRVFKLDTQEPIANGQAFAWTHPYNYWRYLGSFSVAALSDQIENLRSVFVMEDSDQVVGTTSPAIPVIEVCESVGLRGILLEWNWQEQLRGFARYEVQVSDDQTNWYSVEQDGSDWKGVLNADTDWPVELFIHANIPLGGTEAAPEGRLLYYRVRQVTTAEVASGWSTVVSATAGLVQMSDIAARSISSDKIVAGSITGRELLLSSDSEEVPLYEDCDPAPVRAHLFDLSQPDCASSTGVLPENGKETVYAPATSIDEALKEYPHPWSPRLYGQSEAIFAARTNLVVSPEDLTNAWWNLSADTTATLADLYVRGHRLTKLKCGTATDAYQGRSWTGGAFASTGVKAIQFIVRNGTVSAGNSIGVRAFENSGGWQSRLVASVTFSTQIVAASTGTIQDYEWIDDDTVWVSALTVAIAGAANDFQFRFETDVMGDNEYCYVTAVQVEDAVYPSPYIDKFRWPSQVRPVNKKLDYAVTMPSKFVFKIRVRPWFPYYTATSAGFAEWYIDAAHRLSLYYNFVDDKIRIYWQDGGTGRVLETEQFDAGVSFDDINSEIVLFGSIDLTTQTGNNRLFAIVAGAKQAEDNSWSGAPNALTSSFTTLSLGHQAGANQADSLFHSAEFWSWDGTALGTLADETDIDRVTAGLTSLFSWEGESYDVGYKPVSKQGAVGLFKATTNLVSNPEDLTGAAWAESNITPTLSDYYIDGKRFSKLLAGAADGYSSQTIAFTGNGVKSIQCFLRRGTDTTTTLVLNDTSAPADRLRIVVTWATKAFTETTGSVSQYAWLSDDILWIACLTSSVTAANTNSLRIEIDTNGAYSYVTAIQAEDSVYPTPYTPTSRVAGTLSYPLALPRKFTAMFWVRPWFNYDLPDAGYQPMFLRWYIDATHYLVVFYRLVDNTISCHWYDGGTNRILSGLALGSTALLNQWIMVAATIDLDGGQTGSMLKVYAGSTVGSDKDWGGAIDTKASSFPTLLVGHNPADSDDSANSFISDLLILPGQLLTEAECDAHFAKTRPWYSMSEVASNNRQVRIDRNGIRLHNAQINITDWRNRQILISNRDGLLAKDASGKIIHDIPNSVILSDMIYGGHLLWKETPAGVSTITTTFTDAVAGHLTTSAVANVDLTSYVGDNTNVKGVLAFIHVTTSIDAAKVQVGSATGIVARYCRLYNDSTGSTYQSLIYDRMNSQAAQAIYLEKGSHSLLPVVYNNGIPYVSWLTYSVFAGLVAAAGTYYHSAVLYILGVLV